MPRLERLVVLRHEHRLLGQVEPEAVARRPVPLGPAAGRDHVVHRFDDLVHGRARPRRGEPAWCASSVRSRISRTSGDGLAGDGVARVVGDVAGELEVHVELDELVGLHALARHRQDVLHEAAPARRRRRSRSSARPRRRTPPGRRRRRSRSRSPRGGWRRSPLPWSWSRSPASSRIFSISAGLLIRRSRRRICGAGVSRSLRAVRAGRAYDGRREVEVRDPDPAAVAELVDRFERELDERQARPGRGRVRQRSHVAQVRLLHVRVHRLAMEDSVGDEHRLAGAADDHPRLAEQPEEAGQVADVALQKLVAVYEQDVELLRPPAPPARQRPAA